MVHVMRVLISLCVLFPLSALADTVLITGSNRGIGFELAKQFSEQGWDVIATSRSPDDDTALQALAVGNENIVIERLDLTDHPAIDALADKLSGTPIDILLNNAATGGGVFIDTFGSLNYEAAWNVFNVNALGALKVSEAFVDHVAAGNRKMIITLNGEGGSIDSASGGTYLFGASKAALNMVMRKLSVDMKERGITVNLVTPGFVDTMGFVDGAFSAEQKPDFVWLYDLYKKGFAKPVATDKAVARLIPFILTITPEQSGVWLNLEGEEIAW